MYFLYALLYLGAAVIGTLIFYYVVCAAVKNGILEAKKATEKKV